MIVTVTHAWLIVVRMVSELRAVAWRLLTAAAAAAAPPRAQRERAAARHTAAASAHAAVRERAGAAVEWRERMKRPAHAPREGSQAGVGNVRISR